jgi:hypothetical protein
LKKILSLFLLTLIISACSSVEKVKYLDQNKSELSSSYNSKNYDKYLNHMKKNEIFLAGETHGIKENYTLRLNLLMFLNQNAGVKYYLAEMGYSSSFYLNKYLDTGDEKYLLLVENSIAGSYDYSLEDLNFWKSLYRYNRSLKKENRIKIIGLDLEHQFWISIIHLNEILNDKNLGDPMDKTLKNLNSMATNICHDMKDTKNILKNIKGIKISHLGKIAKEIERDLKNRENIYKKELNSDELFDLKFILYSSINTEMIYQANKGDEHFYNEREKAIYKNFLKVYGKFLNGKYFGQWGAFHILQKNSDGERSFASYLNEENSPVKNKVISIKFVYDNKKHKITNKKILKAFKEYSTSKFTFYELENPNSIGDDPCPLNDYEASDITEYFQYGILIRDPKKVTKL